MKIPGIEYGRAVQSLGRRSSASELAVGNAWNRAARQWSGVLADAADTAAESEAYTAVEGAKREVQDREIALKKAGSWNTSPKQDGPLPDDISVTREEIGPDGKTMVPRVDYPMHEIQSQMFDSDTKVISEKYGSKLSGKTKRLFETKYGAYVTSRRAGVLESQAEKILDYTSSKMMEAMNYRIDSAEWGTRVQSLADVKEIAYVGAQKGLWDNTKAVSMVEDAKSNIAYSSALRLYNDADDEPSMEAVRDMVSNDPLNMMDPDDERKLRDMAERKLNRIIKQEEGQDTKRRKRNDNDLLDGYYQNEISAEEYVTASKKLGTPGGVQKALAIVYSTKMEGAGVSDKDLLEDIQGQMAEAEFSTNVEVSVSNIEDRLMAIVNEGRQTGNPQLKSADVRRFTEKLRSIREAPFRTESYNTAIDRMHSQIMGFEKTDIISLALGGKADVPNAARFADAEFALRLVMRANGSRYDAVEWWELNQERFTVEAWETKELLKVQLDPADIEMTNGGYSLEATRAKWTKESTDNPGTKKKNARKAVALKRFERRTRAPK